MDFYTMGCAAAFQKVGADVPGDVWMQRMMQQEGRSPQDIQRVLESHYEHGGKRTLPRPITADLYQSREKLMAKSRAGKGLDYTYRGLPGEPGGGKEFQAALDNARQELLRRQAAPASKPSWFQRAGKALRLIK